MSARLLPCVSAEVQWTHRGVVVSTLNLELVKKMMPKTLLKKAIAYAILVEKCSTLRDVVLVLAPKEEDPDRSAQQAISATIDEMVEAGEIESHPKNGFRMLFDVKHEIDQNNGSHKLIVGRDETSSRNYRSIVQKTPFAATTQYYEGELPELFLVIPIQGR